MKITDKRKHIYHLLLLSIYFFLGSCENDRKAHLEESRYSKKTDLQNERVDTLAIRQAFRISPVLSPAESIEAMTVENGMEVKLVAAEPLVDAPIALTFDYKGRIWVVEMDGYMPDTLGTGENVPNGEIAILEDIDGDGIMDTRKVFLDSLVLPRAISLIDDGLLVAEPPNLWYYEINNDEAGKRVLVDGEYADGGNVEHQPNGLFRALDNWIYNAKSDKRYRKRGDKWLIEKTHFRGQWGITQDNYGRLYYNDNSTNLRGDFFMPGLGSENQNQEDVAGFGELVVPDNRVYPARPTPGVNRGYMEGVLDDSLRLTHFTAASGPVIYRGDLFGEEFQFNGFVAEPAGNLIKRNILKQNGYLIEGKQAYKGKEFLVSVDERFRPVSLSNGPDGALYVVDMYRGIIQHKTYLTPYLRKEIGRRDLSRPLSYGRIYKIVPTKKRSEATVIPDDPLKLVELLGHSNGWVRDIVQQKLIDRNSREAIPALRRTLNKTKNPFQVIHALWTLEGLYALTDKEILPLLKEPDWSIRMQALSLLPSTFRKNNYEKYLSVLENMVTLDDFLAAPYIGFATARMQDYNKEDATDLLNNLIKKHPENKYVADAVISSLENNEEDFRKNLKMNFPDETFLVFERLQQVIKQINDSKRAQEQEALKKEFPKGAALFTTTCATCHGKDGNGVESLAPPLNRSEWVIGDKDRLILIVLFGMSGPVEVNGHLYAPPEIAGEMPGIGYDNSLSNEDIAQLLNYIRKNWGNDADRVSEEEVEKIRNNFENRKGSFTVEEINQIFD